MHLGSLRQFTISICLAVCVNRSLSAQQTEFSAKVVGVQEGDIIKVDHDGKQEKIRLWGIDSPEINQAFGTKAKKFTSDLTLGQNVTLKVLEIDAYKRQVAFVTLPDGRNLNHELVKAGMAWWFVRYARQDTVLEQLEAEAKSNKRGLWSEATPTPPWEHRKHKRGPN